MIGGKHVVFEDTAERLLVADQKWRQNICNRLQEQKTGMTRAHSWEFCCRWWCAHSVGKKAGTEAERAGLPYYKLVYRMKSMFWLAKRLCFAFALMCGKNGGCAKFTSFKFERSGIVTSSADCGTESDIMAPAYLKPPWDERRPRMRSRPHDFLDTVWPCLDHSVVRPVQIPSC